MYNKNIYFVIKNTQKYFNKRILLNNYVTEPQTFLSV